MSLWNLILYGCATLLALQSLVTLMASHKRRVLRELTAEQQRQPLLPPMEDPPSHAA